MDQLERSVDTPPLDESASVADADTAATPPSPKRRHRVRRVIAIALVVLFVPVGWSYAAALTAPGAAPLSARTVEWVKSHGGAGLVLWAERLWYTWHKPPVGGTPAGGLPYAAGSSTGGSANGAGAGKASNLPVHLPKPPDITPIASNPLAREGRWQPSGSRVDGIPAIYTAFLRPDNVHTSLVAGVAWMDTKLLSGTLVAGTQSPGGSWPWGAEVPPSRRARLAATFNSGFLLGDSHGGYYANGRTAAPLVNGQASLVFFTNGDVSVGKWGRDFTMGPDVAAVRQNLQLIVDHGKVTPGVNTNDFAMWGATLGNQVLVWRSGVGVTADGALVYVGGPGLSVQSLANLLVRAGAVRAMELDINTDWVSYNYYTPAPNGQYGVGAHKLLPGMYRPANRYLVPDQRDFVAMFVRPGLARAGQAKSGS